MAFLLGIGSGGWWGGKLADRPHHSNARSLLVLVAKFQVAIAATTYLSMFLFGELPFAFVRLYTTVEPIPALLWPAKLLLAMSLMVPPALLIGATFPALVKAATRDHRIGKPVGQLYGWNTSGAIIGTIVGGLVLLPMVHVEYTIPIAVALNQEFDARPGKGRTEFPSE